MYHIGNVVEVISPIKDRKMKSADASIQAVIRMWDENLMILRVDKKIERHIAVGDYILADYSPLTPDSPYRRMIVTKILSKEGGEEVWRQFRREYEKRKEAGQGKNVPMPYIR